jgi:hypothetical protein
VVDKEHFDLFRRCAPSMGTSGCALACAIWIVTFAPGVVVFRSARPWGFHQG